MAAQRLFYLVFVCVLVGVWFNNSVGEEHLPAILSSFILLFYSTSLTQHVVSV